MGTEISEGPPSREMKQQISDPLHPAKNNRTGGGGAGGDVSTEWDGGVADLSGASRHGRDEQPRGTGSAGGDHDPKDQRDASELEGAEAFARLLSVLGTWKLRGENPSARLRAVLA